MKIDLDGKCGGKVRLTFVNDPIPAQVKVTILPCPARNEIVEDTVAFDSFVRAVMTFVAYVAYMNVKIDVHAKEEA